MAKLADVAREAKVSVGAASSVLGGRSSTIGTSVQTRRRILDAAAKLGYSPSPVAVALSTGRTNVIGLIVRDVAQYVTHPAGSLILARVYEAVTQSEYRTLLLSHGDVERIDGRLMDGCIVLDYMGPATKEKLSTIAKDIPVATVQGRIPNGINLALEVPAIIEAHAQAAHYLYDLGHRSIAVVDVVPGEQLRLKMFKEVARQRNIQVNLQEVTDAWAARKYPSVEAIANMNPLPTAVYAFDDDYARSLIARLTWQGHHVPSKISVFSGSTAKDSFQTMPPLTGLDLKRDEALAHLTTQFTRRLRDKETMTDLIVRTEPVELITRQSCTPPRVDS